MQKFYPKIKKLYQVINFLKRYRLSPFLKTEKYKMSTNVECSVHVGEEVYDTVDKAFVYFVFFLLVFVSTGCPSE